MSSNGSVYLFSVYFYDLAGTLSKESDLSKPPGNHKKRSFLWFAYIVQKFMSG